MSDNNPDLAAQEVDEDLRRDQLVALWKSYGKYIIGAAIGIALTVAGREIYTSHIETVQEENARIFDMASQQALDGDAVAVWSGALDGLTDGYATLAGLQLAEAQAQAGDIEAALSSYSKLTTKADVDPVFADLAHFQAAILLIQQQQFDEAKSRLSLVSVKGKPWYFSAQEQLGFLEMNDGNREVALSLFTLLADDTETPATIKNRASVFRAMLEKDLTQASTQADGSEDLNNES